MKAARYILVLLLVLLSLFTASPAAAATCRKLKDKEICIFSIQRSAKNYWEYRAKVSINGKVRPIEVYNCRERMRILANGAIRPFAPAGAGEFICSFFNK